MIYFFVILVLFIILYGRPITEKWKIIRYLFQSTLLLTFGIVQTSQASYSLYSGRRRNSRIWKLLRIGKRSGMFVRVYENNKNSFCWASPRIMIELAKKTNTDFDVDLVKIWVLSECAFFPFTGKMLQVRTFSKIIRLYQSIQNILESKDEINKGRNYDFFEAWLGKGLLLS